MRLQVTVVDPQYDEFRDVVIDADDQTPSGEVLEALVGELSSTLMGAERDAQVISLAGRRSRLAASAGGGLGSGQAVYHQGVLLDPDVPIAESGLKEGSLLSVGDPAGSLLEEPTGLVEIRVVTGPGSGAVHRLIPGDASIGSDAGCVVRIHDERVPPLAAIATVAPGGRVTVRAMDGAAKVLAETVPHIVPALAYEREELETEATDWEFGAQVGLGEVLVELERATAPDAAVEDSLDPGWIDYNRPPRLLPPERPTRFRLPMEPKKPRPQLIPWMVTLAPVLMAAMMIAITGRWLYIMMALMSPMMMLGNYFQSKKSGKRDYKEAMADFRDKTRRIETDVEQAVVDERSGRRWEAPDPALILLVASGPRMRLWERRTSDPDYLSVRVGVGDLESEVRVEDPAELEHRKETIRTAYDVPVTIPLGERGVIGFAGPGHLPRRLGAWAIMQLAVLQSPRDCQIYLLTDQANAPGWDWLRWLPHAHPAFGQDTVVTIGTDAETCARRVAELSATIAARQAARAEKADATFPDVVVVFDGARRLRMLPGVVAILKQGPALGVHSIALDSDERLLPEEATAVVVQTPEGLTLRQMRVTVVDEISPDLVDQPWLHRTARALAPIRDISGGESDSVLPSGCRLTEVMNLEPLSAETIKGRWALVPRSTEATVGISLDGPFAIDMRRDGPHGLVAGTTGAGKSELLQSIVASLAVANRPDGMTFVLVDYKGGAAFKDCEHLPHTVGMVTDLDTHLVERALISLGAELNRREHILADADAKDIEDYIDVMAKRPPGSMPDMPRLLIVIDEFASMVRDLPDFVTGLVNIAQRGRSLGIHLILATQRPGGVVSPEIRANTNLRIALRVTDASESSDVINSPESARISKSTPGRAYVRLGAASLVPFQSGRVGGRRPGLTGPTQVAPWVAPLGVETLPQPLPVRPKAEVVEDAEITDLKVLVEAIIAADRELGLPPQHSPWLPALTTDVRLDDLLGEIEIPDAPALPAFPYGLEDLPAQQARRNAALDLRTFSHLAVMGGPRSGRSQTLRTMATSIARLASPEDVHLYALDCGNGALLPLAELPHCGVVAQRTQEDRAVRLISRIRDEMGRRQELLGQLGYADLGELRRAVPAEERLPHLVFMIDRWEGFTSGLDDANGGSPLTDVMTMLREGASVGIHLILTGDRQVVTARLASAIEEKIGLRMPDKQDFTYISLQARKLPDDIPDGRAFRSESGLEIQIALVDADPSGSAQATAIRTLGAQKQEEFADLPKERRPFRLDVLPGRVDFDQAWGMRPVERAAEPLWALLGVGGDELTAVGVDLAEKGAAIIAGPPKSGRSTALLGAAESLLRGGTELAVWAPKASPLRDLEGRDGVRVVLTGDEYEDEDLEPHFAPDAGPVVLVVDDAERVKDVDAKPFLKSLLRTSLDNRQAILLGGDADEICTGFSGWQVDLKGRGGILLSPQSTSDGELIGVKLSRSMVGGQVTPGRAMAQPGGVGYVTVQVPLPPT